MLQRSHKPHTSKHVHRRSTPLYGLKGWQFTHVRAWQKHCRRSIMHFQDLRFFPAFLSPPFFNPFKTELHCESCFFYPTTTYTKPIQTTSYICQLRRFTARWRHVAAIFYAVCTSKHICCFCPFSPLQIFFHDRCCLLDIKLVVLQLIFKVESQLYIWS